MLLFVMRQSRHDGSSVSSRSDRVVRTSATARCSALSGSWRSASRRWLVSGLLLVALSTTLAVSSCAAIGAQASGARLQRMQASPNYGESTFKNSLPEVKPEFFPTLWAWVQGAENTAPERPPPMIKRSAQDFAERPASGLRVTWLGHSTLLVEIDGERVLLDPIWSERASPASFIGPKRFHEPPLALDALPPLDAVLISHDHYDHLDYETIASLSARVALFVVPLGVGAHLEYWGIPLARIVELDWWQSKKVGGLELVATPARHFSGRSVVMADRNATLWCGWAILGSQHRVYYSGDTAMFPGFSEIGRRLGPFDAAMIEVGAYNARWADVHLGPEQAVDAHRMVGGKVMIPVHWGTFDLALHAWTEPIERVLAAAATRGVMVATPMAGQSVEPTRTLETKRWWPDLPWKRASEAPLVSSGLSSKRGED